MYFWSHLHSCYLTPQSTQYFSFLYFVYTLIVTSEIKKYSHFANRTALMKRLVVAAQYKPNETVEN